MLKANPSVGNRSIPLSTPRSVAPFMAIVILIGLPALFASFYTPKPTPSVTTSATTAISSTPSVISSLPPSSESIQIDADDTGDALENDEEAPAGSSWYALDDDGRPMPWTSEAFEMDYCTMEAVPYVETPDPNQKIDVEQVIAATNKGLIEQGFRPLTEDELCRCRAQVAGLDHHVACDAP